MGGCEYIVSSQVSISTNGGISMDSFVTGGSGFVGKSLIRLLVQRGWQVRALARSEKSAQTVSALGAAVVPGSLFDADTLEKGMRGVQVVFHAAGWYKLGDRNIDAGEKVNVHGTRCVLETAVKLGIPKILHVSTVAAYGDTQGKIVDETYQMPSDQPFVTDYDRTKWMAHFEVARPIMESGAPVINVLPGVVYGPQDHSLFGQLMLLYYHGLFPVFPGPETMLTFVHVEDTAQSLLLAAEKGVPGEDYIMTGPAVTLGEMVELWARVSGKQPPVAYIPAKFLKPLAPIAALLPLPEILSADAIKILGVSYAATSEKARRELGWSPRPLEEGMAQTMDWIRQETANPIQLPKVDITSQQRQAALAFILVGIAVALHLKRRRK
jgi:dihydroflavonol-4-reductase